MEITVTEIHDGCTVYEYVKNTLKLSRRILVRLKQTGGGICVNDEEVTVRAILHAGDILRLLIEDSETTDVEIIPVDIAVEIIYEDEYLLAVNKPPNMPTHPSYGHQDDTLANAVVNYYRKNNVNKKFRPVNRLDLDTSGIVLISKDQLTAFKMSKQLQENKIIKKYKAVLSGKIDSELTKIETYIRRVEGSIIEREAVSVGIESEYALTELKMIVQNERYSLVEASPITGRTHQLRVHFAYANHPICGDTLYGTAHPLIKRQALHAESIEFSHPYGNERMELKSALPNDIKKLYEAIFYEK